MSDANLSESIETNGIRESIKGRTQVEEDEDEV